MSNWKNLKVNPPKGTCNICVKIGVTYDTFVFKKISESDFELYKYPQTIKSCKIPDNAYYINLNEIK